MTSPAAAAGVSRVLQQAGLRRATEISKGVELEGYYASPNDDHVRVEFVPTPFEDNIAEQGRIIRRGLALCRHALDGKYDVAESTAMLAFPDEMREMPVLEVRSDRWER